jgi:uncharacterized YccA/Bax inhibitor family protein
MVRTSNPAFNERAFSATALEDRPAPAWQDASAAPFVQSDRMTVEGTIYKTAFLLALTIATAGLTWRVTEVGQVPGGMLALAFFFLLGTGIATAFRPRIAVVTGPIYALASGAFIGVVTSFFEAAYPGIAMQAGLATIATLGAMLVAYRTGLIKVTKTFVRVVVTATMGIMVLYVATILLRFVGIQMPLLHDSGPLGILLSLGIVTIAALNLVLDFHFIERATATGAEKRLEWYGAFALLVTLVWLYLEILRLIAKLRD